METQVLSQILEQLNKLTTKVDNIDVKVDKLGLEFEEHKSDIKLVAEGHSILNRKLDEQAEVLNGIDKRLQNVEDQVISHEQKLRLIK